MVKPGWYADYQNPKQRRYHDGAAWTDHVHLRSSGPEPEPPVPPGYPPAGEASSLQAEQDSLTVRVVSFAFFGLLVGFMLGAFLFNGLGSITPVTETAGTVDRLDIDIDLNSGGASTSRSYVLSGRTADGEEWKIVDERAYQVLEVEGYPQPVVVGIGDWTNTPERVTGETWEVDHQSTGARIGWAAVLGFIVLLGVGASVLIAKARSGGVIAAAAFLVAFVGLGNWIGYQAIQWIQSS